MRWLIWLSYFGADSENGAKRHRVQYPRIGYQFNLSWVRHMVVHVFPKDGASPSCAVR